MGWRRGTNIRIYLTCVCFLYFIPSIKLKDVSTWECIYSLLFSLIFFLFIFLLRSFASLFFLYAHLNSILINRQTCLRFYLRSSTRFFKCHCKACTHKFNVTGVAYPRFQMTWTGVVAAAVGDDDDGDSLANKFSLLVFMVTQVMSSHWMVRWHLCFLLEISGDQLMLNHCA